MRAEADNGMPPQEPATLMTGSSTRSRYCPGIGGTSGYPSRHLIAAGSRRDLEMRATVNQPVVNSQAHLPDCSDMK
jgi:hypothetical protein